MSAAPLKPWQRRQGAGTLTESLPPLSGATGGILSAMEYPAHSSSSTATFPSLPTVTNATSSSNAYPAMSSSTGVPPRSSSAVGATSLAAPSGTIASGASAAAPSNIGSMAATAGGASSSTAGIGTSAIPNPATGLGTPGYSSSYGSSYGGYGSRYGGVGSGGSYGGMGMMGGYGGGGMGMMNRYGGGGSRGGNSEFFGTTTDSLSRFNDILALNSFLLDQIYNSSVSIYQRLKYILLWLFELKHAIQCSHRATSDAEKRELRGKILKRMIVLGSLAALFLLWCARSLQRRRRKRVFTDWHKIFPRNSAL